MKTAEQQYTRHVSVPSGKGLRLDKAIMIERPVSEVYAFWRKLDNLPRFMRHLESVVVQDDVHSHWTAKTIGNKVVEWDAEVIEQRENEMISWRSLPGSEVDNAGSVWFTPIPDGNGTMLRAELMYIPPADNAGVFITKLFGRDTESEIVEDLCRLKSFLETGVLPQVETRPAWPRQVLGATRKAARKTDTYVHDKPWVAIASVAAACFVVGLFLGRSRLFARAGSALEKAATRRFS
jgi:uncharacterized membrane protein